MQSVLCHESSIATDCSWFNSLSQLNDEYITNFGYIQVLTFKKYSSKGNLTKFNVHVFMLNITKIPDKNVWITNEVKDSKHLDMWTLWPHNQDIDVEN